jgi:putative chitinase
MKPISLNQLKAIMPLAYGKADLFLGPLNAAMAEFDISTPARQASFLSQIAHESGQLRWVKELASGAAYEGRKDLGNTQPGDGVRFKGRGLLQTTGRSNYAQAAAALHLDCINHPELLEQPLNAARAAGLFWKRNNLNALADTGNQERVTRRVNGGVNGLAERLAFYSAAMKALK